MKRCAQCGGQSSDRSRYCYHCGASLAEPEGKSATVPQAPLVAPEGESLPAAEPSPTTTVDDPAFRPPGEAARGAAPVPAPEPKGAPDPEPAPLARSPSREATAKPGTVVDGKYAIERVIGQGGMGIVYLARELHTGVEVVLKAVRADLAHRSEVRRRTFAEGRALARIDHANVVQLKAVVAEPEELWLVMQYIEGESLEQTIERHRKAGRPLELSEALAIFRQVAAGVGAAHREGLIHRDLKPGNILIRSKDGVVKVTDFGIAKVERDARAGKGETRGFIGSPYYTSPEQVMGQRDLDRRVDIYALGILLYEMLTNQVPFDADSTFEIMRMHTEEPLPPVTARRPELPAAVDDVLSTAAAKHRDERFESCDALLTALEHAAAPAAEGEPARPLAEGSPRQPLGTVSAASAAMEHPAAPTGRRWVYPVVAVVLLGAGAAAAWGTGLVRPWSPAVEDPSPTTASGSTETPSPTAGPSGDPAPASPLEQLTGRWVSDNGRRLEAVLAADALEFRVLDPEQFAPQDYRRGEARFVLHPLEGRDRKFAVEDRIRPLPPAGHRYDSARARTTCYGVWTEAGGEPLRARYDGSQLSVEFAKIEPVRQNFVEQGKTVVSCRGLEQLPANRVSSVLRRP